MSAQLQHGSMPQAQFSRMIPLEVPKPTEQDLSNLAQLALDMQSAPDTIDAGPDAEENVYMPAGYTYLSQFVDHDLTFDTTSTFDGSSGFTNLRTPRFDLDCVYGAGPSAHPYMYLKDGVRLVQGTDLGGGRFDLPRAPASGRAIIGDPRNDENSIVNQIQAGFIEFHNQVAARLARTTLLNGKALFERARQEVRWTYQRVLVDDLLRRLVRADVIEAFDAARSPNAQGLSTNAAAYGLYPDSGDVRQLIPIEFAGAAYRFGHSMVRNGYFLQDGVSVRIFDKFEDSLLGFEPLAQRHVIRQWERFFPNSALEDDVTVFSPGKAPVRNDSADDEPGKPRLQFAYKIDPSVVDPLANLPQAVASDPPPSLIVRNLWRGAAFQLPSGQRVAKALNVQRLSTDQLVVRKQIRDDPKVFAFERIDARWDDATPLWFYVLAEAQAPLVAKFGIGNEITEDMLKGPDGCGVQMGPVGGRILLEVFNGLLDSDAESYRNHPDAADWTPMVAKLRMWDILNFRA